MIAIPLAKKILELFLILIATAALVKVGLLKAEDSRVLSRVALYFVIPCVVFNSFRKDLTPEITQGLLIAVGMAIVYHIIFFGIAEILRRVWKANEVERGSIIFTNAGNLVIPLVAYALGEEWVIYVSGYVLVYNVLFWTMGIRMFDRESGTDLKKLILNPNILAVLAGLTVLITGLKLPETVGLAFNDVAAMIGPLSMIITGMVVGDMKLRELTENRRVFGVILFRMVICSGIAVGLTALSGLAGNIPSGKTMMLIPLLSAIAPSANNINQAAILYNHDAKYASVISILTTLSCIVTIPLWVTVFEALAG